MNVGDTILPLQKKGEGGGGGGGILSALCYANIEARF